MSVQVTEKMLLTEADAAAVEGARAQAQNELLNPDSPIGNVVGVATGVKWTGGEPTGTPAVLVLVTHKVDKADLPKSDVVPTRLGTMKTDVLAVGFPVAEEAVHAPLVGGNGAVMLEEEAHAPPFAAPLVLTRRMRPAEGGYSVGHYKITAGTIATCVYDILPGGSTAGQPLHGVGMPPRYYILSNNHVLANTNDAMVGDPILQPGPYDGGTNPADTIAKLSRWIPITLEPPVPRALHRNLVDAAIAEGQFNDLDREIYWTGYVRGWRRRSQVTVGTLVQKTGRTTNYTTGRITAVNATVDVGYGGGRVGRFQDQILLTNMSAGGDSGSLITTIEDAAVGLLFAGSAVVTIANQIENVRSLLRVEVSERVL
jgi:hypothetical protein